MYEKVGAARYFPCGNRPLCVVIRAPITHIAGISGRGEPDLLLKVRNFSELCHGKLDIQGKSFVRVGMELTQEDGPPATLTQEDFAKDAELLSRLSGSVKFPPTPPYIYEIAGR